MTEKPAAPRRAFLGRLAAALTGGAWLSGTALVRKAEALPSDDPFVGEIRMFGGVVPPDGWMLCEGQLISIEENSALFQVIGTVYGGDGVTTFGLPDMRGRAPIHQGLGVVMGETGGAEMVALATTQIPAHTHAAMASSTVGTSDSPAGLAPAKSGAGTHQYAASAGTDLSSATMQSTGSGVAHNNMQPYVAISFMISLNGYYPTP